MACIAWTKAQLAIMQSCLDAGTSFRAAARELRYKHNLHLTHNVIAGLVSRGTLVLRPDTMRAPSSRVTNGEMKRRLTLIFDAYHSGDTTGPAIAESTGISIHQVWRGIRKLGLDLNAGKTKREYHKSRGTGPRVKRNKEKKKPRAYVADPMSKIGVHFLQTNDYSCRFIIARDPTDGLSRCCGRMMREPFYKRAYCDEHFWFCHKIEYLEAAE